MKQVFINDNSVEITANEPTQVESTIDVTDTQGTIKHLSVRLDLLHTYTSDLVISLIGPDGREVSLIDRRGGSGNHFIDTTFDDASTTLIAEAFPPYRGTFRPEQSLGAFDGLDPNGRWILKISDQEFLDGGWLRRWSLAMTLDTGIRSEFNIDVRFGGGLTAGQRDVYGAEASVWSEYITGDLPSVRIGNEVIDDVRIDASGVSIDGLGGILGQAGPQYVRSGSLLPATGIMEFDIGDLARMEADGSLIEVIIHEMGHVLGIGTLWQPIGMLVGAGTANPVFTGESAMNEFAALRNLAVPTPVPVANRGGPGTREGHWRESVFANELMTGIINAGDNPLSRLTIASLEDLGYRVNPDAAEPYNLPDAIAIAIMGIGAEGGFARHECAMCGHRGQGLGPVVLPDEATIND